MKKLFSALLFGLATLTAQAAVVSTTFDSSNVFSGGIPQGSITVSLTDTAANTVRMDITSNLVGQEFVLPGDGFYFNLTNFTPVTLTNLTGPTATMLSGLDSFKPDGDGLMDLNMLFSPNGSKPFQGGGTGTYILTGAGLNALDFLALSNCGQGCGTGAHGAAVHLGGLLNGNSTWAGPGNEPRCVDCEPTPHDVPEPGTLMLLGVGMLGLGRFYKRKQ